MNRTAAVLKASRSAFERAAAGLRHSRGPVHGFNARIDSEKSLPEGEGDVANPYASKLTRLFVSPISLKLLLQLQQRLKQIPIFLDPFQNVIRGKRQPLRIVLLQRYFDFIPFDRRGNRWPLLRAK